MQTQKIISLFSGCGGLDLGFRGDFTFLWKYFEKHNFEEIWANDINKDACQSYKNFFWKEIVNGDIWQFLEENQIPENADIVLWGFPCQDFSHAGKRQGLASKRGNLYLAMIEVIKKTQPKIFVAENVKWLLTMDKGNAIKKIIADFEKIGYFVNYKLVLAADYGVPQMRERVFIVGTKKEILPKFEFSISPLSRENWINSYDALKDLENIEEWKFPNHFWSKAKRNKWQWNNAIVKEKPAPTIRSEHHGNIEFHWNETRRLSAREAARIQSFPDNFLFFPSTSAAYKQIWNAVPPVLWWHIARQISDFLEKNL